MTVPSIYPFDKENIIKSLSSPGRNKKINHTDMGEGPESNNITRHEKGSSQCETKVSIISCKSYTSTELSWLGLCNRRLHPEPGGGTIQSDATALGLNVSWNKILTSELDTTKKSAREILVSRIHRGYTTCSSWELGIIRRD